MYSDGDDFFSGAEELCFPPYPPSRAALCDDDDDDDDDNDVDDDQRYMVGGDDDVVGEAFVSFGVSPSIQNSIGALMMIWLLIIITGIC